MKKQNAKTTQTQTLAQYVFTTRENLGYSQKGLATRANLPIEQIDDIESGREIFLSTPVRQKLAVAMKIPAYKLKSLEIIPQTSETILAKDFEIADKLEEIKFMILNKGLTGYSCPACGHELICRVEVMYDIEDNMIRHPKARCSKCPMQIK